MHWHGHSQVSEVGGLDFLCRLRGAHCHELKEGEEVVVDAAAEEEVGRLCGAGAPTRNRAAVTRPINTLAPTYL